MTHNAAQVDTDIAFSFVEEASSVDICGRARKEK
jgi:hypothetical protein